MRRCVTCKYAEWNVPNMHPHCRHHLQALGTSNSTFPVILPKATWCYQWRFSLLKWLRLKLRGIPQQFTSTQTTQP